MPSSTGLSKDGTTSPQENTTKHNEDMEETKELQSTYKLFRTLVYVSLMVEFFEYVVTPGMLQPFGHWLVDIHQRIHTIVIYHDGNLPYSKLATIIIVLVTCIGTKNKKHLEFDARKMVFWPLLAGFILTILSIWLFSTEWMQRELFTLPVHTWLYMVATVLGTLLIHVALDNVSKYIKDGIMKDRFNFENESFEQNEQFVETKYSVNIPMRYYHKGKFRHGWININNPFRGTFVIGTPGSGKSFSVIEPFIRQQSAKGFSMVVYDYKFPTLAQKLYYHYEINQQKGKTPKGCKFNVINFVDVEYSQRVNPVQYKYIGDLAAAQETATVLVESLQGGKKEGGGSDDFFFKAAVNFLASCIYFFVNYQRLPYKEKGVPLWPEYYEDPLTHHRKLTGRVFDTEQHRDEAEEALKKNEKYTTGLVEPAFWLGKYSDMPHVLSFLNHDYEEIFEVLKTNPEVFSLLAPFITAYDNKAMEQLEGMIGTLRVQISRLATKESYWVFHRDGDDFDLKVSDPANPSYLLIANDPEKQKIISALNAMILNRLTTRVNSGQGKNIPVSIIVDELPTVFYYGVDNLIATARSNKVCVVLGFQELPQLEDGYGKVNKDKIVSIIGNVICGSLRNKETLEWMSNDIFGKVVQMKKGVTIDRDRTSININENMDNLVPASKISDMATGWLCGQVARDFVATKVGRGGTMDIQNSEEFKTSKFFCKTNFDMTAIKAEEDDYKNYPLPKPYVFDSKDAKERILDACYNQVNDDVNNMIKEIVKPKKTTKD